jgi:hypothetical protein
MTPPAKLANYPPAQIATAKFVLKEKIPRVRNIKDPVANYGLNGLNYIKANPAWKLWETVYGLN